MLRHGLVVMLLVSTAAEAAPGAWSAPVDGVRARLATTATRDDKQRPQLEIWLELENVSDTDGGIPLPWGYVGDMLKLTLTDGGKPVTPAGIGGSHASGPPYVVALPVEATLRIPVSKTAYEYPQGARVLLRPVTFQAWEVPARHGKLVLAGTLSPHPLPTGTKTGARAWAHPIVLPGLELP